MGMLDKTRAVTLMQSVMCKKLVSYLQDKKYKIQDSILSCILRHFLEYLVLCTILFEDTFQRYFHIAQWSCILSGFCQWTDYRT